MNILRVAQDISKDGSRKALISEINADSCKIELFYDDFCVMEIITSENTFELDKKKLSNRRYMQFADEFIESGLNGKSLIDIKYMINQGHRKQTKCNIKFHFTNALRIVDTKYDIDYRINIGNRDIKPYYTSIGGYTYDRLNSMSSNELLELADNWYVLNFESGGQDGLGNQLCNFEYNGYTFYAYKEIIDGMQRTEYLKKIDFLKTNSILKLDNIPDEMKKELAKSKMLGLKKKIMILYFYEDATPLLKLV